MKLESSLLRISLVGMSVIAAISAVAACSTTDSGDDSAAGGSGATTASGGTGATTAGGSSTAGTSGSLGGATGGMGVACPKAMTASLLDFSLLDGGATTDGGIPQMTSFGDFTTTFSGSTFLFPSATQTPAPMYPITADFSDESWHVTGMVGDYSGMGLVFQDCNEVDLSMFSGITFSVKGSVAAPGTAANTLTLSVGTAGDDVASAWLNSHKTDATVADVADNFGRCMPATNQYDGTCGSPSYKVTVTDTTTVVNVTWAQLTGGKPTASVDPTQITSIVWVIPPPAGAGTTSPTPYALDVTLDDIGFLP